MKKRNLRIKIFLYILCVMMLIPAAGLCGRNSIARAESAAGDAVLTAKQASKVELSRKKARIRVGTSCGIRVLNTSQKVKWSVSNKKVVRIKSFDDQFIRVYGRKKGKAVITAKAGTKKLTCTVYVKDPDDLPKHYSYWIRGTWTDGCYYNGCGKRLASMKKALSQSVTDRPYLKRYPYLYIGASRTGNTAAAVHDEKVYFYYCGGVGFRWFFKSVTKDEGKVVSALQFIRSYLKQRPSGTVIIDLGGNDPSNIEAYIGFYRSLMKHYRSAKFRFIGILPRAVGDPSNSERKAFNRRLEKAFPGKVVNLFDKVSRMSGFSTVDGIHYGKDQSRRIYIMTMKALGRKINMNLATGTVTG